MNAARPPRHARLVAALSAALAIASPAHAGIPVIDVTNLVQTTATALATVHQEVEFLKYQVAWLKQAKELAGARGLAKFLSNPLLKDYIPKGTLDVLRHIDQAGYAGLDGAARALRDADMVYNCLDLADVTRQAACQAGFARPYKTKSLLHGAIEKALQRSEQIDGLMERAAGSVDQKEILELQARIAAESALLQHEGAQISAIRGLAEAERDIAEGRAREAQLQQTQRTRRLKDFVE